MFTSPVLLVSRLHGILDFMENQLRAIYAHLEIHRAMEGNDELNKVINTVKPKLVLLDAALYMEATPRRLGILLKKMPRLNVAVFNTSTIPLLKKLYFKVVKARGYLDFANDYTGFLDGLNEVVRGREYFSETYLREFDSAFEELPELNFFLTERLEDVKCLLLEAFTTPEIAQTLGISVNTVNIHKKALFKRYQVDSSLELFRACLLNEEISSEGLLQHKRRENDCTA